MNLGLGCGGFSPSTEDGGERDGWLGAADRWRWRLGQAVASW
jgi:hypothetical protein